MSKIINYIIAITVISLPVLAFASQDPIIKLPNPEENTPITNNSISTAQNDEWSPVEVIEYPVPNVGNSSSSASPVTTESISTAETPIPTPAPISNNAVNSSGGRRLNLVNISNCPVITSYMKYGINNDSAQVVKLQNFLKNVEKLEVDINGIFDKKTEEAVKAFQNKYSETTMGPWSATKGTGIVYITTLKKINQIACNQPLTLTNSELAIINAKIESIKSNSENNQKVEINLKDITPAIETIKAIDANNEIGLNNSEENVASVGKSSIMNKFWDFLIYLFK